MLKINVIDLDKTLVPYDSFHYLISKYLRNNFYISSITVYCILRKLRLINIATFKKHVLRLLRKDMSYKVWISKLTKKIMNDIDPVILGKINTMTDEQTINILLSASPIDYVAGVAAELKWIGIGADIINGKLVHPYGNKKLEILKRIYPPNFYKYNFAISDSDMDLIFMKAFDKYELIKR